MSMARKNIEQLEEWKKTHSRRGDLQAAIEHMGSPEMIIREIKCACIVFEYQDVLIHSLLEEDMPEEERWRDLRRVFEDLRFANERLQATVVLQPIRDALEAIGKRDADRVGDDWAAIREIMLKEYVQSGRDIIPVPAKPFDLNHYVNCLEELIAYYREGDTDSCDEQIDLLLEMQMPKSLWKCTHFLVGMILLGYERDLEEMRKVIHERISELQ